MGHLINPATQQQLIDRVNALTLESPRLWGKMTHPQMLKHCRISMQLALGDIQQPRQPISYFLALFMPLIKPKLVNAYSAPKNAPTNPDFKATDASDLASEQAAMVAILKRFTDASVFTNHPHPVFGHFAPLEWDGFVYWHFDYHLKQFSV